MESLLVAAIVVAAVVALAKWGRSGGTARNSRRQVPPAAALPRLLPYRISDRFLTKPEFSFYHVLKLAVGEQAVVCPKASLGDIFFVPNSPDHQTWRNKIDRKHVDFLLCEPTTMRPIAGVELDDSSHQLGKRVERDLFVEQLYRDAGLPLVRIPVRVGYSVEELTQRLAPLFTTARVTARAVTAAANLAKDQSVVKAPSCPKCQTELTLRVTRRGAKAGSRFYGCPNYPNCTYTVSID